MKGPDDAYDELDAVAERFAAAPIDSAGALLHAPALATPCLERLALACTGHSDDTPCLRDPCGQMCAGLQSRAPDAPALALLDVALSALRPEGAF